MKIYTKTGDNGTTALFGGTRVPKHHIRIDSYGTIDELNSYIGLIRDQDIAPEHVKTLLDIQDKLFIIGAVLATDPEKEVLKNGKKRLNILTISEQNIGVLEQEIDRMNAELPDMTHFILPGGHQIVSFCHIARSICRRAERVATALHEISPYDTLILHYINRLSDYLFVLARKLTSELHIKEVKWIPEKKS